MSYASRRQRLGQGPASSLLGAGPFVFGLKFHKIYYSYPSWVRPGAGSVVRWREYSSQDKADRTPRLGVCSAHVRIPRYYTLDPVAGAQENSHPVFEPMPICCWCQKQIGTNQKPR